MSTWIDFKSLRAQLSFADVLKHYNVQAKIKGERAYALCPLPNHAAQHADGKRTASLSINLTRNIFQCFGCKASGNAVDFAARMEGFDPSDPNQFRQAAVKIVEVFHIGEKPSPTTKAPAKRVRMAETTDDKTAAETPSTPPAQVVVNAPLDFELKHLDPGHPYLRDRGVDPETIEHFGLGYCAKGLMKERVAIPLHDHQGRLIGYAGRLIDDEKISDESPKYLFPGARERERKRFEFHKSEFLYNGHRITAPVTDLIVVEGFVSVWWLHQQNYPDVVSLMGNSASPAQCRLLCELLEPDGRLWVMPDAGEAGEVCAASVLKQVAPSRFVRWVKLDEGQPTNLIAGKLSELLWQP